MFEIKVTPAGVLVFIYEDELQPMLALGESRVRRASYVEPIQIGKQAGQWTVDLSPIANGVLGPFPTRHSALFAEKGYIEQVLFGEEVRGQRSEVRGQEGR